MTGVLFVKEMFCLMHVLKVRKVREKEEGERFKHSTPKTGHLTQTVTDAPREEAHTRNALPFHPLQVRKHSHNLFADVGMLEGPKNHPQCIQGPEKFSFSRPWQKCSSAFGWCQLAIIRFFFHDSSSFYLILVAISFRRHLRSLSFVSSCLNRCLISSELSLAFVLILTR